MNKHSTLKLHTGRTIPVFGLGTWQLKQNTAGTIAYALKLGYSQIDTSSDYKTQPGIGEGIKKSGVSRDQMYLVTKVEETDDAYERAQFNLEELGLDFVDLLLIHRPPKTGAGIELWDGLLRAKEDGLTKDIGVSNYSAKLIEQLIEASGEVPVINQIEWSPFGYSQAMFEYCAQNKILIQAYSPLTRAKRLDDQTLGQVAKHYKKSPAQILIRWSLQSGCIPIPKANQKQHLEENINVFDFEITDEDMDTLNDFNEEYSTFDSPLPYL